MDKAVIRCLLVTAFLFISLFSCGKTDHDSRIVEPSSLLEIGMTEDEVIDMVEKNEQYTFQRSFPLSYICVFDQNNKTETLALTDREKGIVIAVYDTVTADPPTRQQTDRIEKGMSAAEVFRLIGSGDFFYSGAQSDSCYYTDYGTVFQILWVEGKSDEGDYIEFFVSDIAETPIS